jgi:hypothetical protein
VPMYMDFHDDLKLPDWMVDRLAYATRAGTSDEFGVRQVDAFFNPEGKVYCLLEAPDEEAVRRYHTALGVECGDVHEVHSLV